MDTDVLDSSTEIINCTKVDEQLPILHNEGQAMANGLPELNAPPKPTTGGVGRRTSVLFKKAKNGAKLFRDRDNPLLNGKGLQDDDASNTSTPNSIASTPSVTPLSTPSKTPQKSPGPPNLSERNQDLCSDGELEKTPNHQSGELLFQA